MQFDGQVEPSILEQRKIRGDLIKRAKNKQYDLLIDFLNTASKQRAN